MRSHQIRNSLLLVLAAFIWGVAFVAQSAGGALIGPYTFVCVRNLIGSVVLLPVIRVLDRVKPSPKRPGNGQARKVLIKGGVFCGIALYVASALQQVGINLGVSAGKAGFLTACYILLVPILGIFLKKKCGLPIWMAVAISLVGLYFLCIQGSFGLQFQDGLVLLCALCFAVQILLVDHFSPLTDGVRLASLEFLICGIAGVLPMVLLEMKPFSGGFLTWLSCFGSLDAWIPLLYAAVFSSGVAYTLQIIGQEGLNPTLASLLMSLESVFSVLAGWALLKETLSLRELCGCAMIFAAILIAQVWGSE